MPFPALLGIPWLASAIASGFMGFVTVFSLFVAKKFAYGGALVASVVLFTVLFTASIQTLINGIQLVVPGSVNDAMSLLMPSNYLVCISLCLSARTLLWVYDYKIAFINLKAKV